MKNTSLLLLSTLLMTLLSCSKSIYLPVDACPSEIPNINLDHPKAAELQVLLDKYVKKGFPGVTALIYTPEDGKWIGTAGLARIEDEIPMQVCHIFHSASVAKTYHAVAALTLVDEGRLELDQPMATYLPDWVCRDLANIKTATVRQLMNHSSGIPDFIEDTEHVLDYFNDLLHTFTTHAYLDYVCGDAPDFAAGERVSYSNTNTVLLALIMDEVAGNHADVISEKIIRKLNLKSTFYKNEPGYPAPVGVVNTYVDFKEDGVMSNSSEIERNFAAMSIGHDGMLASAHDYFRFIKALFDGELLSESSLAEMVEPAYYQAVIPYGEGLGIEIVQTPLGDLTRMGHNGGSLGAANNVFYYPEQDTYIVICSNFGDFLNGPLSQFSYSPLIGNQSTLLGEVEVLLFGQSK
ncbi:MAG: serine hydrolase domain-containing protein [Bacteroidota bacterium]